MTYRARRNQYTLAEYVAFEQGSNTKHEYLDGEIYAMAGGTPEHAALSSAVIGLLTPLLREGRCRPLGSDARVHTPKTGLSTYPDVSVVCGPRLLGVEDRMAIVNPTLLVEVLSRATEKYDRDEKFEHYKTLETLQQYVLVSQREHRVEVWSRDAAGGWTEAVYQDGETAPLASIGASLDIRELYTLAAEPT